MTIVIKDDAGRILVIVPAKSTIIIKPYTRPSGPWDTNKSNK